MENIAKKDEAFFDNNPSLGFSIVLCTYNGQKLLKPTLEHLAALQVPDGCALELVVVDNASTDGTASWAAETWLGLGEPFPLRVLTEGRPGKGYAVEMGYDAARYSYILTVDDDNWLSPDYLTTALGLLEQYPDVGVLQGRNEAVYETAPPEWVKKNEYLFVIGSPVAEPGYFPANNFSVWGAGMVIRTADWRYLRSLGFAFLTSKVPGKAAGEDHETAIGLLLLGRRIYYSDKLTYKHFMPAQRLNWDKLKESFPVFSYVGYYILLYAFVMDSNVHKYNLKSEKIRKVFFKLWLKDCKYFTLKQHLYYWVSPNNEYYQLRLKRYYATLKWILALSKTASHDIKLLQRWMQPLLKRDLSKFKLHTRFNP